MKSEKAKAIICEGDFYIYIDGKAFHERRVMMKKDAIKAVELAEQEAEERMREKAHRIIKEMMESIFHGDTPRKIADEFSKKLNENGND